MGLSVGCRGYVFQGRQSVTGADPMPTVLSSEFHGVWAHTPLAVLLPGGTVHLPHKVVALKGTVA